MKRRSSKCLVLMAVAVLMLWLQAPLTASADDDDPPGRVARLNYSQGPVSFQAAGEDEWVTAVPNRPIISGDNLWAGDDALAELHLGSTALRLNQDTGITFLELNDHVTQIRLAQGSLMLRIRHLDDETFEVDTPNLAFSPLHPGEYRIDVNGDGTVTVATVWSGRGEATGGGQSYDVLAGQRVRFEGTNALDFDIGQIPPGDPFVDWALQRDAREDRADSANYLSREMTGYEDLDDNGNWRFVANYGNVWVPAAVPVGWAPYRFGHWVYIRPWGWTWVDDEPWGFAPFHYGRWAWADGIWCWVPGPVVVRPVYAPALVAFVGGVPLGVYGGSPGVAWFPLAPGEVFVPMYRTSRVYVNNVNITNTTVNVTKVTNVYNYYNSSTTTVNRITYVNQHVTNAVTAVSHETFVNARPVAKNVVNVPAREIEQAQVTHTVAFTPVKNSVVGAGTPAKVTPPAQVATRPVIAKRPTPPPPPTATAAVKPVQENKPLTQNQGWRETQPGASEHHDVENKPTPPPFHPPTQAGSEPQPHAQTGSGYVGAPSQAAHIEPPPPTQHPLVRPAPPVQPKSPQQWAQEEAKNRNWQQQREAAPVQRAPQPQTHVEHPPQPPQPAHGAERR